MAATKQPTRACTDRCAVAKGHAVAFDRTEGSAGDRKVYRREEESSSTLQDLGESELEGGRGHMLRSGSRRDQLTPQPAAPRSVIVFVQEPLSIRPWPSPRF